MPTYNQISLQFIDHSGESANTSVHTTADPEDTEALIAGFDALSADTMKKTETKTVETFLMTLPAEGTDNEKKLLIGYQDQTTYENFVVTVPAPNFAQIIVPAGTDYVDMVTASYFVTTFVPAFNLAVLSPRGNAVGITYAKIVGRNV